MAIAINGNGTITGITAGGLPDASIEDADIAAVASGKLTGTIADARLPTVPVAKGGTGLTAAGASGQVLTSDGTNWASAAAAAGGTNGWELLATNIVTSAAASSDFTSVNTTDYKMHMIHYYDWHTGSGNIYPNIRLIDASGPISASNYYGFIVRGKYNSATVNGVQMNAVPYINLTGAYNWSAAANPITGYCIFSDVGQAGVRQGWWGQSSHHMGGTADLSWSWYGGMSTANTAVTGYMLRQDSGNFNKGKFQLYGLKGS